MRRSQIRWKCLMERLPCHTIERLPGLKRRYWEKGITVNDFFVLFTAAKEGNKAASGMILDMYRPLLYKESVIDGIFDEDLFQELCIVLLNCIAKFVIRT